MDLSNFQKMDPHLLVGVVNTALRNSQDDLEDFCHLHDIEPVLLKEHLQKADYEYRPTLNQFR